MFRFPWGDMHSLNLGWFLQKFNELREDWATAEAGIDGALDAEIEKAEDALSDVFAARDAAAASATAAAGSATAAGTSATAAQNSATGAASSATLANQKATAAGLSEAAAAQSATQAGNSATAAAGSATTASTAATNAAGSATAAGNSASAAAASAASIEGDVDAAAASAAAAAASAASVASAEDTIEDINNDRITTITMRAGSQPLDYPIEAGVLYKFNNQASATINISGTQDGTTYKTLVANINSNDSAYIFTTAKYTALRYYANAAGTLEITKFSNNKSRALTVADLIAPIEDGSTASRNYNINELFILNGMLWKVTAAIAEGTTIRIGRDCTETTISNEISLILGGL